MQPISLVVANANQAHHYRILRHPLSVSQLWMADFQLEGPDLSRQVADQLITLVNEFAYANIILVAPPEVLSRTHHFLPPSVSRRVVATLDRDFCNLTDRPLVKAVWKQIGDEVLGSLEEFDQPLQ